MRPAPAIAAVAVAVAVAACGAPAAPVSPAPSPPETEAEAVTDTEAEAVTDTEAETVTDTEAEAVTDTEADAERVAVADAEAARLAEALLGDTSEGPATEEMLDRAGSRSTTADLVDEESPEIVFDLAARTTTGGPAWLTEPLGRRQAAMRGCFGAHATSMDRVVRATIELDEHGAIASTTLAGSNDLRACLHRVLRASRVRIPADVAYRSVYVRIER